MSELPNLYEATFLDDEKTVEETRFLRGRASSYNGCNFHWLSTGKK